jgi:cytidine deaminase
MTTIQARQLVAAARAASERAYAPYSRFRVGAALLGTGGATYTGCNVENVSLGLTMCAERVAVGCAVAAGERGFRALAIYSEAPEPAPPCGACRQVLREFAADLPIYLAGGSGGWRQVSLADLYPMPFAPSSLPGSQES